MNLLCNVARVVDVFRGRIGLCYHTVSRAVPVSLGYYIKRSALNLDHIFLGKSLTLLKYLS